MKECVKCKKPITKDQDYVINAYGKRMHDACHKRSLKNGL